MKSRRIAVGDREWTVRVDGPETQHSVLLLPDAGDPPDVFDRVCARLHNSDLRTIAVETIDRLDTAGVYAILDELGVPWVNVAGRGAGASVAWQVCATGFGRFISLVVADRGHPAVPDAEGAVLDPDCRAVELPTTVLVTKSLPRSVADTSGRYVYGEYRVVALDVDNVALEADHELATEIVLRTSLW
ncbi:alpha/beta hydrolase [Nocardia cyriacigeorgica]|uniref:alpha/beta hydrolase n=1 Tax=Nocardia cyriacigeorgica TaxID=135487 RepID=UPI001896003C|nr:alpha/beta hydrolase [Nocardia cyriacigeorgica]MBF6089654.1 alpha/beta hydrolase [Nocardia cyriacigeorgica]MBF6094386.1 alpha/beta hydrolase [Nocardia cyriacigeorgica]MBF6097159.1 alpha/beta hydrolase [Nocardia cyriacigeorgica]MBF6158633.1 alpha/beta hydrolase [Nocardia cyriacigeorgica]MBF6197679.1 alpha/beta hydrolase [Nocardia cyriacigeorgica]